MSDSSRPHDPQHACLSPTPRVHPNPCPLCWWCHPTIASPSPAFNLSQYQGLSNESVLHIRSPKFWSFSFSISPSNEYSGLISFRLDWLDLLAVQGTLKSLLQHHSLKASILQHFNLFYGLTFTSMHDYWENHRFAYMNLCQKSDVSAFQFAL